MSDQPIDLPEAMNQMRAEKAVFESRVKAAVVDFEARTGLTVESLVIKRERDTRHMPMLSVHARVAADV